MKSRFQTLIKTRNHYGWLAITGDEDKESYEPAIEAGVNCCFCCKFTDDDDDDDGNGGCDNCPLNGYAWKQNNNFVQCHNDPDSIYKKWHRAKTVEEKQYWAMRMVKACDKALEDLIIKGDYR